MIHSTEGRSEVIDGPDHLHGYSATEGEWGFVWSRYDHVRQSWIPAGRTVTMVDVEFLMRHPKLVDQTNRPMGRDSLRGWCLINDGNATSPHPRFLSPSKYRERFPDAPAEPVA
jgi:hypothetical protein